MKRNIGTVILLFTLSLLFFLLASACKLPFGDGSQITPERAYSIARLAAYGATVGYSVSNPEMRPALQAARDGFAQLKQAETWDILTAGAIAQQNGLTQLNSTEGQLILSGVPMLLDLFSGQTVDLKKQEYARATIEGIADGMALALGAADKRSVVQSATLTRLRKDAEATRRSL